ncbi:MAG: EVE domain-containing protein [Patescibacteria group bacterium]
MKYWLIKSEPDCYSIDDLKKDKKTAWTGVRNYQARNFIREMKQGDLIIYYHSSANPPSAVGIAKVVKNPYPEIDPLWSAVDVGFVEKFKTPLPLPVIKMNPKLEGMLVTQQGSRLSIQPVSKEHFNVIQKLGNK